MQDLDTGAQRKRVAYLGLCFTVLFGGFVTAQSLITNLFGIVGFYALFSLYLSFSVAAFMGDWIISYAGTRKMMAFGASTSLILIGGGLSGMEWLFIAGSISFGAGSVVLWEAQATYFSRITQFNPHNINSLNAIFFIFYAIAGLAGNTAIGILLNVTGTSSLSKEKALLVLWTLFGICACGSALFFFMPAVPPLKSANPPKPFLVYAKATLQIMKNPNYLIWLPYVFVWIVIISFGFGQFPLLIPVQYVPWTFTAWGVGFLLSTVLLTKFDKLSIKQLIVVHLIDVVLIAVTCLASGLTGSIGGLIFTGFLFGLNESLGNNICIPAFLKTMKSSFSSAIVMWRSEIGISFCCGFIISTFVEWTWLLLIITTLWIVSCVLLLLFFREEEEIAETPKPEDTPQSPQPEPQTPSDTIQVGLDM
uniref:UNC93-like protein MFSD11 n=1 Tax=Arcella intermedia TaxID=1963864 RepID=A0A6B2L567_9EUKA